MKKSGDMLHQLVKYGIRSIYAILIIGIHIYLNNENKI